VTVLFGVQGSGQHVGEGPDPGTLRRIAAEAESAGFDSLWASDHLSFVNPIHEPFVALATFAATTERILLGTGVLLLPLRHPALVAKAAASLDVLSGGRLLLGVGVGGEGEKDFEAAGVPRSERGPRTDEAMEVLRALWRGGPVTHRGRFYAFAGVEIAPVPARPGGPPLLVGGRSAGALRRAGRLGDGWLAYMASPERFARDMAEVRRAAEEAGRDPAGLLPALVLPAHVDDDGRRAAERMRAHLSTRYAQPVEARVVERYTLAGTPEQAVARLQEYAAAGVRHVVLNPAGPPGALLEETRRLAADVVDPTRRSLT
jgi:probable F420-dependent oxidoreductase